MIYTHARRRAMNNAVRSLYPNIDFYEPEGVPVMECGELPEGACRIEYPESLFELIDMHCIRRNEMGMTATDYGKALPVFIRSMELTGRISGDVRHYYRVNYVSPSSGSKELAAKYIAEGKLYAVVRQDTCNP